MKPAAFEYYRPESTEEVLVLLSRFGSDAKILAGGQSLVPMLNMRLLKPSVLLDISRLDDARAINMSDQCVEVGASVTQSALQRYLDASPACDLLQQALPWTGHWQTRQRGTVCGSIVHSDPSSELPLCLKVMRGEVVIRKVKKSRAVSAEDFQVGLLDTDVHDDEMVTAVRFPRSDNDSRFLFREVSQRHGDFAIVAIAVEAHAGGYRLGVGGVADVPAVKSLPRLDGDEIDDALNDFAWELRGSDDVHASARYRRELVRRLGKSMIEQVSI